MNNRFRITAGLFVAFSFIFMTGFHSHGCGKKDPASRMKRMNRFVTSQAGDALDEIDATDQQNESVHAIKDRLLREVPAIVDGHQKGKRELHSQWTSEKIDESIVHATIDQQFDTLRRFVHQLADGAIDFHRLLTPEQRKAFNEEYLRH